MAGVALAVGCLLDAPWLRTRPQAARAAFAGGLAVCAVLALAAMQRQRVWHDPVALWQDAARKNPAAFTPASGLGDALREVGRLREAEAATRGALQLCDGKRGDAWATLALILDKQGRTAEATEALAKALEVDPRLFDPPARVAVLAMDQSTADALVDMLRRLRLKGSHDGP
jgi:tetratricopeptide (TPR) repeat protein